MEVRVEVDARRFRKEFRELKNKAFANAFRDANDAAGYAYKRAFSRQWKRSLNVKRKNYIRGALTVRKSFVDFNTGLVKKPTVVVSRPFADELLRTQIYGNPSRNPRTGRRWFVQAEGVRKSKKTYVINNRWVFRRFGRKDSKYLATLTPTVDVPGNREIKRKPDAFVRKFHPKAVRNRLLKELRFRQRRSGR